jgi:hypothetical protein
MAPPPPTRGWRSLWLIATSAKRRRQRQCPPAPLATSEENEGQVLFILRVWIRVRSAPVSGFTRGWITRIRLRQPLPSRVQDGEVRRLKKLTFYGLLDSILGSHSVPGIDFSPTTSSGHSLLLSELFHDTHLLLHTELLFPRYPWPSSDRTICQDQPEYSTPFTLPPPPLSPSQPSPNYLNSQSGIILLGILCTGDQHYIP